MAQPHVSFKSVKEGWLVDDAPKPIQQFLTQVFEQLLPQYFHALRRPLENLAHGVSGTEIEGEEISLGMLFFPKNDKYVLGEAAVSESIRLSWKENGIGPHDLKKFELNELRKVLDTMRDSILGWTPGYYDHPLLVFSYDQSSGMYLEGANILHCTPHVADIECAYNALSEESRLVVWVKPYGTIRLYHSGNFIAHIVKLRDVNSWAFRSLPHLRKFITTRDMVKQNDLPKVISQGPLDKLLLPLMAISEEKKGAALYVISKSNFEEGQKGGFIARTKHKTYGASGFNINDMPVGEILTYLRQDGSVIIDEDGNWLAAGAYFNSSGGRKGSARDIAIENKGHAFLVSQDGGLYFFSGAIKSDYRTQPPGKDPKAYPEVRLDFLPIDRDYLRLV